MVCPNYDSEKMVTPIGAVQDACPNCGADILHLTGGFCDRCGTPVPRGSAPTSASRKCPSCGTAVPAWMAFCDQCGTPVSGGSAPTSATRKCSSCGAAVPAWMAFCDQCGTPVSGGSAPTPVTRKCSSCGAAVPAWMAFCDQCGTPVKRGPAPAPAPAPTPAPAPAPAPAPEDPLIVRFPKKAGDKPVSVGSEGLRGSMGGSAASAPAKKAEVMKAGPETEIDEAFHKPTGF